MAEVALGTKLLEATCLMEVDSRPAGSFTLAVKLLFLHSCSLTTLSGSRTRTSRLIIAGRCTVIVNLCNSKRGRPGREPGSLKG